MAVTIIVRISAGSDAPASNLDIRRLTERVFDAVVQKLPEHLRIHVSTPDGTTSISN